MKQPKSPTATRDRSPRHEEIVLRFAARAYAIPGVQAVFSGRSSSRTTHLWTVVQHDDPALREQVYDAEAALYPLYPKARLDFYVLTIDRLDGKTLKDAIPVGFTEAPRGTAHAAGQLAS